MRGGISEKFRSALCLTGRATDERGGDGRDGEEDCLSALPDDVLLLVLLRLPSSAAAARTSILSRRWRHLWTHLQGVWFPPPADHIAARTSLLWRRLRAHLPRPRTPRRTGPLGRARAALAAQAAPALRYLHVFSSDTDPGDAAAVLLLAAPRLAGTLFFDNKALGKDGAAPSGALELPCFEKAKGIYLRLGYLGLVLPPSGVFAKLAVLDFENVRFHGPCNLGDAVSSARCPSLQYLHVNDVEGVSHLDIHSESLLTLELNALEGLQQLTVVAPRLRFLCVSNSFMGRQAVADLSVPVLDTLKWVDEYDPSSVQWGKLPQLRELRTLGDLRTEFPDYPLNRDLVMLLQRFWKIPKVYIFIYYPPANTQYLAEVLTFLPTIDNLHLGISTLGHGVGPYIFHFLRISSGIRKLQLRIWGNIKGKSVCSPGCDCHQPQDSETEGLIIDSLQEVYIYQCRGAGNEIVFLKRLLRCASALKTITVDFDPLVTVREELCQELLGLSKPETCMKIYLYRDGAKVMYAPVS